MGGSWSWVKDCLQQLQHWMLEKVGHWVDWWVGVKARLRFDFSNQQNDKNYQILKIQVSISIKIKILMGGQFYKEMSSFGYFKK